MVSAPPIFRQFLDPTTRAASYLLADASPGEAVLIDPVREQLPLYLSVLRELRLRLVYALDTHLHADHVTAAATLREITGARIGIGRQIGIEGADLLLADGTELAFGGQHLQVLATPGHTPGCVTYRWRDRLFTGDALLIGGCGNTRIGDAGLLYDSITRRILRHPDDTLIYPGHLLGGDSGQRVSCVAEERARNPFVRGLSRDEFIAHLARQRPMAETSSEQDTLLAANRHCGASTA